ncbi:hypothetical protein ACLVWU_06070 [Bdellovibrio sp. HCB290]|uniref:hypothetical protein n=1 Tax=Bdellovibrio sp. HCB290 TaxID=3394356 RepID=UPI0039B52DD3
MSNDIEIARTTRVNTTEKEATTASTAKETGISAGKKGLFGNLNSDLKKALDTWDVLTETVSHKVSPEQEQLQEVKKLLGDLKAKLAQFDE